MVVDTVRPSRVITCRIAQQQKRLGGGDPLSKKGGLSCAIVSTCRVAEQETRWGERDTLARKGRRRAEDGEKRDTSDTIAWRAKREGTRPA